MGVLGVCRQWFSLGYVVLWLLGFGLSLLTLVLT